MRRRTIEAAGRQFKSTASTAGIAALMADAGLTNGAFCAHVDSKDDLVASAVADRLREQREMLGAAPPGHLGRSPAFAALPSAWALSSSSWNATQEGHLMRMSSVLR